MRAAVLVFQGDTIALIERVRDGRRYYLFPGGQVEPGERPEDAARREAHEELGLSVEISRLVARATFGGNEQRYYLARATGGLFGAGDGNEMTGGDFPGSGSYRAVLWPIAALPAIDLRPADLAAMVERSVAAGWPAEVAELAADPARPRASRPARRSRAARRRGT
jgi:8-oxo-dGTP diphosphatase